MSNKKVIPSIHIPIQRPDGSMEWVWYMFFQWLSDNFGNYFTKEEIIEMLGDYFTKEEIIEMLGDYFTKEEIIEMLIEMLGDYFTKEEINEMLAAYALDDNVVHKHGPEETITSEKRFTAPVSRKLVSYAYTETPSEQIWCSYHACDKNNETWASCDFVKGTSGQNVAGFAVKGADGTWCDTGLGIGVTLTGDTYTYAPIPPATSSTSNKQIATCGWVNDYTLSTGIVHRTGNENIAGVKEFTTWDGLRAKGIIRARGNQAYTESTSGWTLEGGIHITGPNDTESYGAFETIKNGGSTYSQMNVRGRSGNWGANPIAVGVNENGITFTFAPSCDWNNSIVTTVDKSKSSPGFFKLGNGLIIQWGFIGTFGNTRNVTFPTAFTDTNYVIVANNWAYPQDLYALSVSDKYTTNANINCNGGATQREFMWIAIGY